MGDRAVDPPAVMAGTSDIFAALSQEADARRAEDYRVTPVQPTTLFDGFPAYLLTVSCDHPDIDPICPFTWRYYLVDLDQAAPGLYADFSAQYAAFVDAGNAAVPLPEEFAAHEEMVRGAELTVDGA